MFCTARFPSTHHRMHLAQGGEVSEHASYARGEFGNKMSSCHQQINIQRKKEGKNPGEIKTKQTPGVRYFSVQSTYSFQHSPLQHSKLRHVPIKQYQNSQVCKTTHFKAAAIIYLMVMLLNISLCCHWTILIDATWFIAMISLQLSCLILYPVLIANWDRCFPALLYVVRSLLTTKKQRCERVLYLLSLGKICHLIGYHVQSHSWLIFICVSPREKKTIWEWEVGKTR